MKYGQISNSSISGFAGASSSHVPVLPSGETGIVLSLPFQLSRQWHPAGPAIRSLSGLWPSQGRPLQPLNETIWGGLPAGHLDDLSFMYGMTYFDRVAFALPANPYMGHIAAELSALQLKLRDLGGFTVMPLFPEGPVGLIADNSDGSVTFDPVACSAFQNGILRAFSDLLKRDGAGWEIGNGAYGLAESRLSGPKTGVVVRLIDRLPVVHEVSDPENWMIWKEDVRPHRVALRTALNDVVASLGEVSDGELRMKAEELGKLCDELVALSKDRFPGVRLRPVRFHYDWSRATKYGTVTGLLGGILGEEMGVSGIGELAGFLAAGIRIEGGPTLKRTIISESPFASVVELQYRA